MDTNGDWEVMEDNDEIIQEFRGYKDGLLRNKKTKWTLLPKTVEMLPAYKVIMSEGCRHTKP